MGALANLVKDDGSFANDLVDYQSRNNYKEYGAESKTKVELASVDIIVWVFDEKAGHIHEIFVLDFLILEELLFCHSRFEGMNDWEILLTF